MPATLIVLQFFILNGCFRGSSKPGWSTSSGAEEYERLMWQAIRDKDWMEVEHHLAPVFVGVNTNGQKFDHAGWVDYWKSLQVKDFSLGELTVEPEGADMVVIYDLQLSGASGSSIFAGKIRVVSIWQQLKAGWVLISQAQTPIR